MDENHEKDVEVSNDKSEEILEDKNENKDINEESQDVKSDLTLISNLVRESESEKRCTSASGAGESEYESVDDEVDDVIKDGQEINKEIDKKDQDKEEIIENEDSSTPNEMYEDISTSKSDKTEENDEPDQSKQIETVSNEKQENQQQITKDQSLKDDENQSKEDLENVKDVNEISNQMIDEEGAQEQMAGLIDKDDDDDDDDDDDYEDIEDTEEDGEESDEKIEAEDVQTNDEESKEQKNKSSQEKKVDIDEDKKNPQYIPKRGPFYEHDDRMTEEGEIEEGEIVKDEEQPEKPITIAKKPQENEEEMKKKPKKKLWDESDRWGHDMFNEKDQIPKTRDELVEIYGYDIRNEEDAPKSRRRRRYGRGPNKYTRQWQDEDAYARGKLTNERGKDRVKEPKKSNYHDDRNRERMDRYSNKSYRNKDDIRESNYKEKEQRNFDSERNFREKRRSSLEQSHGKPSEPFCKDDFPALPSMENPNKSTNYTQNDVYKKLALKHQTNTSKESEKDYKTEPMKVIEAIENRANYPGDSASEIVRTQTFENSRFSYKKSNNFEQEEGFRNRARNNKTNETFGRAIRKTNNLTSSSFNSNRESGNDFRVRTAGRNERGYNDEPNQRNLRYFNEDNSYQNPEAKQQFTEISSGIQKMGINDKTVNKNGENEQPRPKRYSSLRQQQQQQQQRLIGDNVSNVSSSHIQQQGNSRNINQFYEATQVQPAGYYQDTQTRNAYHSFIQQTAADSPQQHSSRFMPQQMPQRYIPQTAPPPNEARFLPSNANVPVPSAPPNQSNVPPVIAAPPPAPTYMTTYTPSGYPQFPPPPPPTHVPPAHVPTPAHVPPPTHVPPGYHTALHPPQPGPQPTAQQLAELYRSGVTYYDTQSQQHSPRQIPQRRPKAAIPIVPPPDSGSADGDGDKSYVAVNS